MKARVLIAGIGNIFLGDDAFGVEVVRRISQRRLPDSVRTVDFGIRGLDLAYALTEGYETAILVDATPRGGAPGTLYTIEPDLERADAAQSAVSAAVDGHSMDPVRVLGLAKTLGGELPRILIVGCEPETFGTEDDEQGRMGLSKPVEAAVEKAVEVVASLAARLLAKENGEREPHNSGARVA
jgi:hydrogenase maturation protease